MFDTDGDSLGFWVTMIFIAICALVGAFLAAALFDTSSEVALGAGAIAGGAVGVTLIFVLRALVHRALDGVFHLITEYPYVTVPLIAIGAGAIWYFFV